MAKPSLKSEILCKGFQVFIDKDYSAASVRDISAAAGVSLGTFTGHFASKEVFALEALNIYYAGLMENLAASLKNETLAPMKRLKLFFDVKPEHKGSCTSAEQGCRIGQFGAGASKVSEPIRLRTLEIFTEIEDAITECLKAAVKNGDLPKTLNCKMTAGFINGALQGAHLLSVVENSNQPIERFKKFVFSNILQSIKSK